MKKVIDGIYNKLLNDIKNEIAPKIAEEMKNIEQEVIEEVVYNAYTPIYYERRTSGGLGDKENMKETITDDTMGGMVVKQTISVISKTRKSSNGGWL